MKPEELVPVRGIENVSDAFKRKVIQIAANLNTDPNYLMAVMSFESGGTFSPDVKNMAGSGATGLIQFMPETAIDLGTTTEHLARMTPEKQLDFVAKYFEPYRGRLNSIEDVYMAVLYPAALGQGKNAVIFPSGTTAYKQNVGLDLTGDGNVTVGEATQKVREVLQEGLRRQGQNTPYRGMARSQSNSIQLGDYGEAVQNIQKTLKEMGYSIAVDGIFGKQTQDTVINFQISRGITPTGTVDAQTLTALQPKQQTTPTQSQNTFAAKASAGAQASITQPVQSGLKNLFQTAQSAVQRPTLQRGDRGEPVKQLQQSLNRVGIPVVVDGIFGPETQQGVTTYQTRQGLQVDGIAGPQTWGSLQAALQQQSSPTPPSKQGNKSTQTAPIRLDPLATPPGNTYYGAPRPGGRKHAGVDAYNPNKTVDTEAPPAILGGRIVKVGYDPKGYGHYIDIHNEGTQFVERIAEFTTPQFTQADVGKTIPAGTVVGVGAHQTGIIHREFRPYEIYQKGGYHQYGFEGTVNWQETVKGLGLYRQDGNNLVPTGRMISQQVGAVPQKTQASPTANQGSVSPSTRAGLTASGSLRPQIKAERTALEHLLADSPNLDGNAQESMMSRTQTLSQNSAPAPLTSEQSSNMELG